MANYAALFSKKVDERFRIKSQASMVTNNDYKFTGVKTVNVYSLPVAAMNDYSRTGSSNRYGTPSNLERSVQALTITRDRSFAKIIERGDNMQNMNIDSAGRFLADQIDEVIMPEYDSHVFATIADGATKYGNVATGSITASNAYASFLAGQECLSDQYTPLKGRVAVCSHAFANLLKQDSAFVKYGDRSQEMLEKGIIGEVDGTKIMETASGKLPAGAAFIITHPKACVAPKQLEEYRIHDDAPGYSGWLIEGRFIYDAFTLNEKARGIYYHGSQAKLRHMFYITVATAQGKSTIVLVNPTEKSASTNKWYYCTASTRAGLASVTYGTAITTSDWTELTAAELEITPTSGDKFVRVIECAAETSGGSTVYKPISVGDGILNIGT